MFSDTTWIAVILILSIPVYLALSWVHGDSRRRLLRSTDDLVVTELIRERRKAELEIARDSLKKRLNAVRTCESRIYGYMPSSDHPDQLRAVVSIPQAEELFGSLREYSKGAEQHAQEQQAELERYLEEKQTRIQALNRRFRVLDRIFAVAAAVVRVVLVVAVLYGLVGLLFGPFM